MLEVVKKIHLGAENNMILTYRFKHHMDFNQELSKARKIVAYINNKSSGMPSSIGRLALKMSSISD